MPITTLIKTKITGIQPVSDLPIDEHVWREAHSQHTRHDRLHAGALHRPGIVYGLEVLIHPQHSDKLLVAPGLAIDDEGRVIIVQSIGTPLPLNENGVWYIVATYSEVHDSSVTFESGGKKQTFRVVEQCQIKPEKSLPSGPYIELARVEIRAGAKGISYAVDPFDPGPNELNLLYRQTALPWCVADGAVSELSYTPKTERANWKPNRPGIVALVREANVRGQHLSFGGPARIKDLAASNTLLAYIAGDVAFEPFNAEQAEGLRAFIQAGGVILGESLSEAGGEFEKSFTALAGSVGAKLSPVTEKHAAMTSLFVFGGPPEGANAKGKVLSSEDGSILFSTNNYGTAWRGIRPGKGGPLPREICRESLEFGLNLVAHAALRRREAELDALVRSIQAERVTTTSKSKTGT